MTTIKTTININEETWKRFKKAIFFRQGSLRNLSGAVEEAIKAFDMEELMNAFMEAMGIETGRYPSLNEVEEGRPRPGISASETVRAMRDDKHERVSGHERPC